MSIEAETERLQKALDKIDKHLNEIDEETTGITEIKSDIMNKLPDVLDHNKLGKLGDAILDLRNGAYVLNQGIVAARKVIKEILPTFTRFR